MPFGMAPTQDEVEQSAGRPAGVPSGRRYWGDIEYDEATGKYYGRGTDIQLGTLTPEQMAEIRKKRQALPEFQLSQIVQHGGLTPQERGQLSSVANRQLGLEAQGLQRAYERSLAGAGGRQAGSSVNLAGNRLLGAQLDVQNRLNEIAVDRKQKALMTLLQLQEQRKAQRQAQNQAERAQKMAVIGKIFEVGGKAGLGFLLGGPMGAAAALGTTNFSTQTPGTQYTPSNFQYDNTRYA